MRVAVVGATGLVGSTMLRVLEEKAFPVTELIPVASARSAGKTVSFGGKEWTVLTVEEALERKPQLALFSAGGGPSLELAPRFAQIGCRVIDNSSAWRMDETKKLVVPEVNGEVMTADDFIIANPNCSTVQMVMVLKPLHDAFRIRRVVVSTYQSVSGTGANAVQELMAQRTGSTEATVYPYPIDLNLIPQIDVFTESGNTKEEEKMIRETAKIMGDASLKVAATCVRVPVVGGHSESVNVEFEKPFEIEEVRRLLAEFPGVTVQDNPAEKHYPMPLFAAGDDRVFVGRLRRDTTIENGLQAWIVSDNLRKGAATNAVQIAVWLLKKGFLNRE